MSLAYFLRGVAGGLIAGMMSVATGLAADSEGAFYDRTAADMEARLDLGHRRIRDVGIQPFEITGFREESDRNRFGRLVLIYGLSTYRRSYYIPKLGLHNGQEISDDQLFKPANTIFLEVLYGRKIRGAEEAAARERFIREYTGETRSLGEAELFAIIELQFGQFVDRVDRKAGNVFENGLWAWMKADLKSEANPAPNPSASRETASSAREWESFAADRAARSATASPTPAPRSRPASPPETPASDKLGPILDAMDGELTAARSRVEGIKPRPIRESGFQGDLTEAKYEDIHLIFTDRKSRDEYTRETENGVLASTSSPYVLYFAVPICKYLRLYYGRDFPVGELPDYMDRYAREYFPTDRKLTFSEFFALVNLQMVTAELSLALLPPEKVGELRKKYKVVALGAAEEVMSRVKHAGSNQKKEPSPTPRPKGDDLDVIFPRMRDLLSASEIAVKPISVRSFRSEDFTESDVDILTHYLMLFTNQIYREEYYRRECKDQFQRMTPEEAYFQLANINMLGVVYGLDEVEKMSVRGAMRRYEREFTGRERNLDASQFFALVKRQFVLWIKERPAADGAGGGSH